MEKIIAACGLDCAVCKAHIASRTNDQALREATAKEWSAAFNFAFTPEMINCHGCFATDGVQIGHCSECEWRACVVAKGYKSCAECTEMVACAKKEGFYKDCPEALANLQALKRGV